MPKTIQMPIFMMLCEELKKIFALLHYSPALKRKRNVVSIYDKLDAVKRLENGETRGKQSELEQFFKPESKK